MSLKVVNISVDELACLTKFNWENRKQYRNRMIELEREINMIVMEEKYWTINTLFSEERFIIDYTPEA